VPGLFVTGTGTGVGKTVVAAAIAAALRAQGQAVVALKPVLTGLADPPDPDWPPDHELLARAAGGDPAEVALLRYQPAVSPHLAAEQAGTPIDVAELAGAIRAKTGRADRTAVVEGVGGLLVPLGPGGDVRALAAELGLPLVIAAQPGLGTINHTLLTVEAARQSGLTVAGVVMTPWPTEPDAMEQSNRSTIERLAGVEVVTLPRLPRAEIELLERAGQTLPLRRWLATA
jgi:dethiobiotin synthetase